jgi:DNA-binding LytR/AlgR family response regulator
MKLSCIIVDDEPLAIDLLSEFISKVPFLELKGSFSRGLDALAYINDNTVDIVFLDIQMDDISGIQLLRSVKEHPDVILTTAYDQYAVEGYSLDVSDYLLKPIAFERFIQAVERVYSRTVRTRSNEKNTGREQNAEKYIFIKADGKLVKVYYSEILFIEGQRDYLKFHLTGNRRIMTLLSFRSVEDQLPVESFLRIHKSYIVAADKIDTIGKASVRIGDREIPVGENYRDSLSAFLGRRKIVK